MRNTRASVRDMIISLAVLLVPVVALYWFFSVEPDEPPVPGVDVAPVLTVARGEAPFEVLAPTNLPDTWKPTRVAWAKPGEPLIGEKIATSHAWVLGILNPERIYLALEQRDGTPATFIAEATRDGKQDGTSTLVEETWTRYVSADGRTRALVMTTPEVTTIVSGDTSYEGLEAYVTTLSAG